MFDRTLGNWKIDPVDFESKEVVKPISSIPYPVPKLHKEMIKNEVECWVLLGVIERANNSEWGAPSFTQPKHK